MSFVLWFTGLPCSGKTTIANKLKEHIDNLAVLDGDSLREWFSPKDFSRQGRIDHNRRVAMLARLLMDHRVPVCVSLISPYKENRVTARQIIGDRFIEVYAKCPLEACEKRDTKGMYSKARQGLIKNFTGIDDPYEPPEKPDLVLDTEHHSAEECVRQLLDYLSLRMTKSS
jgi:adenylylsulfate kinase